jgi:hypothetical protein
MPCRLGDNGLCPEADLLIWTRIDLSPGDTEKNQVRTLRCQPKSCEERTLFKRPAFQRRVVHPFDLASDPKHGSAIFLRYPETEFDKRILHNLPVKVFDSPRMKIEPRRISKPHLERPYARLIILGCRHPRNGIFIR